MFCSKDCDDREHRIGLCFGTQRSPLFLTFEIRTRFFFLCPCFVFHWVWSFVLVCMLGAGVWKQAPLPPISLSQVMCLFSWTHLLVYCVVAFLPSYRLALVGHFSPSNPVHHILVLESVKWVLEKRGHNVCLCCYWTQMGLVFFFTSFFFFCPGRCINGSF